MELMKNTDSYTVSDEVFYHYRVRSDSLSHGKSFQRAVNEQYLSAYVWHRIRMLFPDFPLPELNRWFFRRAVSIDKNLLFRDVGGVFIPAYSFPKCLYGSDSGYIFAEEKGVESMSKRRTGDETSYHLWNF